MNILKKLKSWYSWIWLKINYKKFREDSTTDTSFNTQTTGTTDIKWYGNNSDTTTTKKS